MLSCRLSVKLQWQHMQRPEVVRLTFAFPGFGNWVANASAACLICDALLDETEHHHMTEDAWLR